uniref:Zinc transporter ZIP3 n=1 Tax=Angiostrongylus cantonensis TaxID=6313 RepID=A0A0K0DC66_ANGCA
MLLLFVSAFLIFTVLICCTFFPYFYLARRNRNGEKHIVSLSICNCVACGVFLSACFLGLIPHVRHQEQFINPRHVMHSHVSSPKDGISARTLFLLFGLSTHSLFEGIALGVQVYKLSNRCRIQFLYLLFFSTVLCCIAYGVSLAQQHAPVRVALPTVLILSASIPAGIFVAVLVDQINSNTTLLRFIMEGLAAGTFVYVACVEMLSAELSSSHAHAHIGVDEQHGVHHASRSPFQVKPAN